MAVEFKLPDIGEGIAEGEIVRWMVEAGATVGEDEPLVEVMTDKATVEIPSPAAGTILEIRAQEGETVPVGDVIVVIGTEGESSSASSAASSGGAQDGASKQASSGGTTATMAPPRSNASASTGGAVAGGAPAGSRVLATPATRKLAREMGVNLAEIAGTGPNGRVTREDVARFVEGAPPKTTTAAPQRTTPPPVTRAAPPTVKAKGQDERIPLRGLRKRIAEAMRISKDHAAHFTYVDECDVTALKELRQGAKEVGESRGVKITYMPFIMKATVAALKRFPNLNANFDDANQELIVRGSYNLGFATDTPNGLIVPVVHDVDRKTIFEIAQEMTELIGRAREGKSKIEDLQGGTFTITNAGNIGGLFATPVINYPEVAIVGVHKMKRTPVVMDNDEIAIRDIMYLSISLDHRVIDGADGARFMNELIRFLEDPKLLLLETV